MYYTRFTTQLGKVTLVGDHQGLRLLHLNSPTTHKAFNLPPECLHNDRFFAKFKAQLRQYLSGKRQAFTLKLNPQGTAFQQRVWAQLGAIPYGETRSYQEIAVAIGHPLACRAVGMANNRNPISMIIPCHRVIGKNGRLTGYASGLATKDTLLTLERKNRSTNDAM